MSRLKVMRQFKYAYGGVRVVTHLPGTFISADDEAAPVALSEGWAVGETPAPAPQRAKVTRAVKETKQ